MSERQDEADDRLDRLAEQLRQRRGDLETFCRLMQTLLASILEHHGIAPHQITGRCKDEGSFREKIERKGYTEPFRQMKDLVGLRVILYFNDEVDDAVRILRDELLVDEAHSRDWRETAPGEEDRFGYSSYHLVCQLKRPRADLPEWSRFREQQVEIQVRTILQHTWAEINHHIFYKSTGEPSTGGKRSMAALKGTLDIVEGQFMLIRDGEHHSRDSTRAETEPNAGLPVPSSEEG